jgi:glycosyltransferase involved in cell wall biosynthesis
MVQHWFVVPALDGPVSGGTLYNRELLSELQKLGARVSAIDLPRATQALSAGSPGCYWVDSLFLDHFQALSLAKRAPQTLGLIAHYLPSLVEHGDELGAAQLTHAEAFALTRADAVLAPSSYLKDTLLGLGLARPERCLVVEPGCFAPAALAEPVSTDGVRALVVANLTPGKGVAPFLRALGAELTRDDELELSVVGRLDLDPRYAEVCSALIRTEPSLRARVRFAGGLAPSQVVERLSRCNVLVSASRMESFGMALAEARTLGVPLLARSGGNTRFLVDAASGGLLVESDQALARACCELARDRRAHARAAELAWRRVRAPRSFAAAAADFLAQLAPADFAAGP